MEKAYQPSKYEAEIYRKWEESGAFKPIDDPKAEPFSILMPPPNANADLHIGHTLTTALEDIMVRYARMQGKAALFLPGADHAGFETQVVYERKLEADGKSRFDFSREDLYQQIWDYVQSNKTKMEDQQRRIGASVDWSRNTFTLDPHVVKQVYKTFQQMHDDGLLYRGQRIVNYCTKHGTSFSELEVEYKEEPGKIWDIRYPLTDMEDEFIVVATTRPETMLGDSAIAVHPDDKRYAHLIGKTATLPLMAREIPIVADELVDPAFGTGAVKVTPAHDPNDFEIGQRHNLPRYQVIAFDGLMQDVPEQFLGLDVESARKAVIDELTKLNLLGDIKDHEHSVGHCYKCGTAIQPLVMDQWLVRMKPLAERAIAALEAGEIKVVPHRMLKVLFQWLENIRDWNISRQIVWGIPIPAFIAEDGDTIVDIEETSDQIERNGKVYTKDTDTFDTWFSSGQWPFTTLHYPDGDDFKRFYPTSVMETAGEIIFFWVARMIMLGLYITDEVPFKAVYLHGLVLDAHGKKMSKSRGNVIAPMVLLDKYGADATRLGLVVGRSAGLNQGFDEKRVEGYRNFCNKLWNVARFSLMKLDEDYRPSEITLSSPADHWIANETNTAIAQISEALDTYRFSEAIELTYHFIWHTVADTYIEQTKNELNAPLLACLLETCLRLIHPAAPFVSEAIWQQLPWTDSQLISEHWPNSFNDVDLTEAKKFESEILAIKTRDDSAKQLAAAKRELDDKQRFVQILESKLANKAFVEKAPKELVDAEKAKLKNVTMELKELQKSIDSLENSSSS